MSSKRESGLNLLLQFRREPKFHRVIRENRFKHRQKGQRRLE
jgi:hypothetical protein